MKLTKSIKKFFLNLYKIYFLGNQKINFILNALIVWTSSQVVLHICLLFFSIPISVFISICFYIPLGYFFYGKNVFGINKFSRKSAKRYILLTFLTLVLNTMGTSLIHSFGINKNISALIITPFLAVFSYTFQKYFVFK
tara:strand:- start:72 stop:488 length:417 start_codon:yes stop_codon:yes gene_type:complete